MNTNIFSRGETMATAVEDTRPPRALPEKTGEHSAQTAKAGLTGLASSVLSACGGGASGVNDSSPSTVAPTETQAARFLMQASFGGTYAQVQDVQKKGYEAWLDAELNRPWIEDNSHFNWFKTHGYFNIKTLNTQEMGVDNSLWCKLMTGPDVLRIRVAFALSQIFVVSMSGLGAIIWRNLAAVCYMDLLEKNAFGTYEDLLRAVTLSPAMGTYLNMKGSRKATDTSSPDENYAREVMQLFSIGLYNLNADGSLALSNNKPVETYNQQNVTDIAKIFTGWNFSSSSDPTQLDYLNQPMTNDGKYFTTGDKPFFYQTVPSTAKPIEALNQVLKYLANHQNVGPFIGRQLIQRLVCSNPSPAYVNRITNVFNNDGKAVRGNLKAVIKAILLDEEARKPDLNQLQAYGKLKEPVHRLAQWGRTFNVNSTTPDGQVNWNSNAVIPPGPWNMDNLSDDAKGLGQAPMRSPTVFNFYRPGYVPLQGSLAASSVTAPEFQICNEVTVAAYINFMKTVIEKGRDDIQPDYSDYFELAKDPQALVNRLSLLLTANTLSATSQKIIIDAVAGVIGDRPNSANNTEALDRVRVTILMIMATPEYMIQK